MQRRAAVLTALVLALAACGRTPGGGNTQSTGPAASSAAAPSPSPVLIVVAAEPAAGYQSAPTPVRLMRPDGKEVDRLTVKQGARGGRAAGAPGSAGGGAG